MMMDDYKVSDKFNGVEGSKVILPHHFHPTNGVTHSDSNSLDGTADLRVVILSLDRMHGLINRVIDLFVRQRGAFAAEYGII
jgi:hypothetical protein